ncbi:MAG: tetratricopeptide repeat protein [Thermogemmatispora sp.]|uniref:tetratricopeptide repeat protein n=1 Tax=Thermogemmatispora sp. TaxID=1968838 RepID=UPI001A0FA128|nr:tetratricopeptide repeat protein [Thermogemmatispora sp.]MBE3564484.1 tetratricopeptide repeat protein [Thermogemmatispora sp.]
MERLGVPETFLGRDRELSLFLDWLANIQSDAPWILSVHDAEPDPARRGGIGKTWFLRACVSLARQRFPHLAVVQVDFFRVADRDRLVIARRVVERLQAAYPHWQARAFAETLESFASQGYLSSLYPEKDVADIRIRDSLSEALARDVQELLPYLPEKELQLLLVFDTFELVERSPQVAVLGLGQLFPERYGLPHVKVLLAGRNPLDWQHPTWHGREKEVLELALPPFSPAEVRLYLARELAELPDSADAGEANEAAADSEAPVLAAERQARSIERLYELTAGRPILVGLACDLLARRLLTLDELVAFPQGRFEEQLVVRINDLERPLNWLILVLAHVYHRLSAPLLSWLLTQVRLTEAGEQVSVEEWLAALRQLSFVRAAGEGDELALHDEMRRLVVHYCWERQDPDRRFRRELSRAVISYYEQQNEQALSEQEWQASRVELLAHWLTMDVEEGLRRFQRLFGPATVGWRSGFARTLLETVRDYEPVLTPAQRWQLRLWEAQLLRIEEQPHLAQALLERLQQEADPSWLASQEEALSYEFARCALQQQQLLQTIHYYEQCLDLAQRRGDEEEASTLQGQLGYVYRRLGQWDEALRCYRASLAYYQQRGSRAWYANLLNSIGQVYRLQGRIEEALRYCLLGLRVREELWSQGKLDERAVGLSHSTLALISLESEDLLQAERHFRHAFECYALVGDRTGLAATSNRLGQVALRKGQLEEANTWFKQAEALVTGFDEEVFINSQYYQGRVAAEQGHWQEALTHWQCACEHARHLQDRYQLVTSLCDLVEALSHLGRHEEAQAAWREARTIAEEEGYCLLLGRGEEVLGDLALAEKRVEEAFQQYVDSCAWMTHHHFLEYHKAQRRLVERLLSLPLEKVPPTAHLVSESWRQRGLAEPYPELYQACEEIAQLLSIPG